MASKRARSNEGRILGSDSDAEFHAVFTPDAPLTPPDQLAEHRATLRARGVSEDVIARLYPHSTDSA